ncbi:MAG: hypothetical protein H6Q73_249 [Firmicutes bacterium]|nr:hypothetical protein [Bacillota bacterium]
MPRSSIEDYFAMKIDELCQALTSCTDSGKTDDLALELEEILQEFTRFRKESPKERTLFPSHFTRRHKKGV